jgi:hypothetical protein
MSLITAPEAERRWVDAQAVIAEAREHARHRRRQTAVILAALTIITVAAVLTGRAVIGSHGAAQTRPRSAAAGAGTGIVTGHLAACFGIAPTNGRRITPGTVVALRGQVTWKPTAPGTWMLVYPKGPAVSSQHISNNYDQTFRFALPPGHYVIAGRYGNGPGSATTFREVTVTAGANLRVNLPNVCK